MIAEHEVPIGDADETTGAPVLWDPRNPASQHLLVLASHPDNAARLVRRLRWVTSDAVFVLGKTSDANRLTAEHTLSLLQGRQTVVVRDQGLFDRTTTELLGGEFSQWLTDLDRYGISIVLVQERPNLRLIPSDILACTGRVILGHANPLERAVILREPDLAPIPTDLDGAHIGVAELPDYRGAFAL